MSRRCPRGGGTAARDLVLGSPDTWRREMLATAMAGFAPVQVAAELEGPASGDARRVAAPGTPGRRMMPPVGRIEVEFPNGVRVRVDGGVDEAALRGVLAALDEH